MPGKYKLQLPPDAHWTEWRDLSVPVTEELVLSVLITEDVTLEQCNEFMQQFSPVQNKDESK